MFQRRKVTTLEAQSLESHIGVHMLHDEPKLPHPFRAEYTFGRKSKIINETTNARRVRNVGYVHRIICGTRTRICRATDGLVDFRHFIDGGGDVRDAFHRNGITRFLRCLEP